MFRFFGWKRKKPAFGGTVSGSKGHSVSHRQERRFKKVDVHHLKIGMFVSELDRPWAETPFVLQGFYIYRESDIDEIKKYSRHVYIDEFESRVAGTVGARDLWLLSAQETQKFPGRDSWAREQKTYERVTQLTFGLLDKIAMDSGESSDTVRKIVDSCVESVISNPYALALISQMERVSARLESHAIACCALATSFGRFLNLDDKGLHDLALGALLHDVGMLKLPPLIINREGTLTPEQYATAQTHASLGSRILTSNEYYWPAVDVAYAHHEHVDGSGYPRKLKDSAIPYNARIIAIIDTYDRLTSSDSYRRPTLSPTSAMGEIYAHKGTQFDAQLVEKFIRFMGVYPLGTLVELNSGETAIVAEKNPFYMILPKVLVVTNRNGEKIEPFLLDLFAERQKPEEGRVKIAKTLAVNRQNAYLLKEAASYSGKEHSETLDEPTDTSGGN